MGQPFNLPQPESTLLYKICQFLIFLENREWGMGNGTIRKVRSAHPTKKQQLTINKFPIDN
jgi:hypothetical protein